MFPLDPIAAGAAFFRGGLLDGGLDLLHFGISPVHGRSGRPAVPHEAARVRGTDGRAGALGQRGGS
jgi:hypothetical protein